MSTLSNVTPQEIGQDSPSIGFIPFAFPKAKSSKTGVSVSYVPAADKRWYIFRASYGREEKAFDFLVEDGTYPYIAKQYVVRHVNGKRIRKLKSLIPNLIFVYTTERQAEIYINSTPELSFLSFYLNHFKKDNLDKNPPLTVPDREMETFIRTAETRSEHLRFVDPAHCHYKSGETVRVIDGMFKGVEGRVARVSGQQRVIVSITNVGLISTAYIPTAFIEKKT